MTSSWSLKVLGLEEYVEDGMLNALYDAVWTEPIRLKKIVDQG